MGKLTEPLVWESTTPCYIRFISDRRYRAFRPYARKWYRPICPQCGARTKNTPDSQKDG